MEFVIIVIVSVILLATRYRPWSWGTRLIVGCLAVIAFLLTNKGMARVFTTLAGRGASLNPNLLKILLGLLLVAGILYVAADILRRRKNWDRR